MLSWYHGKNLISNKREVNKSYFIMITSEAHHYETTNPILLLWSGFNIIACHLSWEMFSSYPNDWFSPPSVNNQ